MTIDPCLLAMMPLSVSIQPYTGQDAVGNNTYGTAVVYRARPEAPTKTMLQALADPGTQLADPGRMIRLIIDYQAPGVSERAKVTMSDGTTTYTVVSVLTEYDENGPYYQDLTCENNKER